jgi:catechol 2,3-dioxygenase-like lactoylglutathione lyase family enzyme
MLRPETRRCELKEFSKSVSAITLFVADLSRSREFYERVFEVAPVDEDEGTVIFKLDNLFLRLLSRAEAEKEMLGEVPLADPGSGVGVELAMRVPDVDARAAVLAEHGVPIAFGPVDRPWGVRHVAFRDPDGHLWVHGADIPTA